MAEHEVGTREEWEAAREKLPYAQYAINEFQSKSILNKSFSHRLLWIVAAHRTPPIDPFQKHG